MTSLYHLEQYLRELLFFRDALDLAKIDPHMANGLMVRGGEEVGKIGFGVSASVALFGKAKKANCDALIVHHSFNLPPFNRYDSIFQNRLSFLLQNGISLFGYHYLLDAHPKIGNNVEILKTIGAEPVKPTVEINGANWGWQGNFSSPVTFEDILKRLKNLISKQSVIYYFGPKKIENVIACSGMGAPREMQELIDQNIDLYITGEVHEWNRELFKEAGINFIAGGHYATEVFGVKALMRKVKDKFPRLQLVFLDFVNEI